MQEVINTIKTEKNGTFFNGTIENNTKKPGFIGKSSIIDGEISKAKSIIFFGPEFALEEGETYKARLIKIKDGLYKAVTVYGQRINLDWENESLVLSVSSLKKNSRREVLFGRMIQTVTFDTLQEMKAIVSSYKRMYGYEVVEEMLEKNIPAVLYTATNFEIEKNIDGAVYITRELLGEKQTIAFYHPNFGCSHKSKILRSLLRRTFCDKHLDFLKKFREECKHNVKIISLDINGSLPTQRTNSEVAVA